MITTGCVVIGAGLAAANVVQTLREQGYEESITLIGAELDRPYERPPLSKGYLQGHTQAETLFVHPSNWYADQHIDTRFGVTALSIDPRARRVQLSSGRAIGYRQLVISTGSRPRRLDIPGGNLAGVHYLRQLEDSDALRAVLLPGARIAVIGAGWIGLEVAAAARAAGCEVSVLEFARQPLRHVLGDMVSRFFADLHRGQGVDLRTGTSVSSIVGRAGQVVGVQTAADFVPADVVVVGIGAIPNTELAADARLETDRGIAVDQHLRTSDPAIYAAGDVATAFNTAIGERLRVEHWDNAIRQAKLVATSILGRPAQYDWQPYFYSDQYDTGLEYVGHGGPDDDIVIRGDIDDGKFIAFWLRDNRIRAAMNVNIWDVSDDLRALVGRSITTQRLVDPAISLSEL